jgi:transposase
VAACDGKIEAHLQTIDRKLDAALPPLPPPRHSGMQPNRKHIPQFDVRTPLYQITGVDLTQIDGIGVQTAEPLPPCDSRRKPCSEVRAL